MPNPLSRLRNRQKEIVRSIIREKYKIHIVQIYGNGRYQVYKASDISYRIATFILKYNEEDELFHIYIDSMFQYRKTVGIWEYMESINKKIKQGRYKYIDSFAELEEVLTFISAYRKMELFSSSRGQN